MSTWLWILIIVSLVPLLFGGVALGPEILGSPEVRPTPASIES